MTSIDSLSPEDEASYTIIIDSILAASDLDTISEKRIRKGLEAAVQNDLTSQKHLIKSLIMARFDKFNAQRSGSPSPPRDQSPSMSAHPEDTTGNKLSLVAKMRQPSAVGDSGADRETPDMDGPDRAEDFSSPPQKKRKAGAVDDDARLAAALQAEENKRVRATRGGTTNKTKGRPSPAKKKKSRAKVEESGTESESGSRKKRNVNRNGGFHKQLLLSPALSEFLGETTLSRPETVKRLWAYFKEHDLQDPEDKRQIRCDAALKGIFKQDRVHMFTMNKMLSDHLFAPEE